MIKEEKVTFDKINEEYIIIINNNWYKYEIICSYSNKKNKLLISNDMILIPKILKGDIFKNINLTNLNKKKLETILENKKNKYIDIICNSTDEYNIYYGLTKIIKT